MSLSSPRIFFLHSAEMPLAKTYEATGRRTLAAVAWHSLLWLVVANFIGVLLAVLLLAPGIGGLLGEWTYGRWLPVHMNLQLYGWCSLPLVGFLFEVYGVRRNAASRWASPVLWLWSIALAIGSVSWLQGVSSGKLFLDWTGYARVLFPLALWCLWGLLAFSFFTGVQGAERARTSTVVCKALGLAVLLLVPAAIFIASNPVLYPPINPDTGGPTGASQLESTLVIVAILLLIPFGISSRKPANTRIVRLSWVIFAAECLLCVGLGREDVSHHKPTQWIALGSLLVWIPLMAVYYGAFRWHGNTRRWLIAFLCWWSVLIPTGWMLFLPGVLDRFKFTDGLVGHSLLAMAGFVSSLLIFALVQIMGDDGWIFNTSWSFYVWQASIAAYVAIMFVAGWREGSDPSFAIVPGHLRDALYVARLCIGLLMLVASFDWFRSSFQLFQEIEATVIEWSPEMIR